MYLNSPNVQPMWYIKILAGFECTYPVLVHFRNTHIAVQKLTTFFKNYIFEKLESQFTIIKYADIVN